MNSPDSVLEKRLWSAADKLRSNMDAAEYKHVVLGLIFLKYASDSFEEIHRELENDREHLSDPEDRDEYIARNVFWVPPEARWNCLLKNTIDFSNYFNNTTDAIAMFMLNVRYIFYCCQAIRKRIIAHGHQETTLKSIM